MLNMTKMTLNVKIIVFINNLNSCFANSNIEVKKYKKKNVALVKNASIEVTTLHDEFSC